MEKRKYTIINVVEPVSDEERRMRMNKAMKIMLEAERRAQLKKQQTNTN
ncbi:MAG: hypothetical protein ACOWWH_00890 [Eubacteriaceae bacterium]